MSLELPGPLCDIRKTALRAAPDPCGFVVDVLLLHVPLQFGRMVKLGGAEGAVEGGLGLKEMIGKPFVCLKFR